MGGGGGVGGLVTVKFCEDADFSTRPPILFNCFHINPLKLLGSPQTLQYRFCGCILNGSSFVLD